MPNDHALTKKLHSVIHSDSSPLFIACVFGLSPILDDLAVITEYDWNQTNDLGQSGLYLAVATGQEVIVQRLLQHEVEVNTIGGKFGHALHAACFGGHVNIVKMLLDHGAEPKIGQRSALEYAILAGHENTALLLLDGKFDISDQGKFDSVLQQAAEAGFTEVLHCLQRKYGSLYGELGSLRCKAIQVAVFKGRMGVVERYMQKLNNPRTDMAKDAIATAALGGQDAMIEFLLEKGLDANEEGVLGTPLRAASIMCHESTVWLLLRLGASLHVSSSFGEPLQAAAMRGHQSITRALLSHGADVNNEGGLYGTALQAAAHRGHREVVEILLDAGADVHREGFSRDAFHAASEGGHEGIVRLLLDKGYIARHTPPPSVFRSRSPPSPYWNPLRDTSPSRSLERKPTQDHQPASMSWRERAAVTETSLVVEMVRGTIITDYGIPQPYRDQSGRMYNYPNDENHPLRSAAAKGHLAVIELLLGRFDELNFPESEIVAAFKEACENGHEQAAAKLLSDRIGAEDLKEALKAAALQGHLAVVNLLIDHEEMLGLAQVESTAKSPINYPCLRKRGFFRESSEEHYDCDSTARLILDIGSKGCHLPIFRRGQDLVAQRCTDAVSRHLYGQALTTAAANSRVDVMKAVFDRITEIKLEELAKTLESACARADEKTLLLILKRDAKKVLGVQQYSSGLSQASRKHNRPLVVYWLKNHPERQNIVIDPAALINVSGNGFMDILPMLIQHSRPTDSFEKTLHQCLQAASRNGHEEAVQYLITEGADVNTAVKELRYISGGDRCSDCGLSHDFDEENVTTRKLSTLQAALLGFERFAPKPELGLFQQHHQSAWIEADILSQQRCVEILLARGADPNGANKYNRYPLNIAAAYCTVEIVRKLISSGARVGPATKKHGTPLEAAARRETDGSPIVKAILKTLASESSVYSCEAAALNEALSFFDRNSRGGDGQFTTSTSITDVLSTGPGAVVRILLTRLPNERTDDSRYRLLLQMACMAGDRECVELLLQRGIDVNRTGGYYGTTLQAASRVGNIEIVDHLLDSRADVNIVGGAHGTALRAAVLGGHEDIVRGFLACGADVNLRHEDKGKSVLHIAVESKSDAIFKALFVAGAAVSTANLSQQHILITACKQGRAVLVELLLASGVDVNISGIKPERSYYMPNNEATPLNAACAEGHPSVVRLLLDHEADIERTNESSATPLIAAISGKHLSVIRLLLDAYADVNHAVDSTPLSEAAEDGKLEIVEELLNAGAIIGGPLAKRNALAKACNNRQHMVIELLLETLSGSQHEAEVCGEALSEIMERGDPETIFLLLERVASPSFDLLRQACSAGVLEAVEMLVNTGIDVNEHDGVDAPLLHVAASHLRPEIVQYLLNQGANVTFRSPIYGGPLIAALEGTVAPFLWSYSQPESCQSLVKQLPLPDSMLDIDIYYATQTQRKPGFNEIRQCEQVVQSLFEAGAEMDTTLRTFGSALHLASYLGSQEIVRHLLQGMEDINIFGGYFESPLIAAVKGNHAVIAELLLDRGVNVGRSSPEHGSALRCACAHGSMKLIRSLLDHGADVNAHDDENQSALARVVSSYADSKMRGKDTKSSEERRKILEMLLGHEPKVNIRECDLVAAISSDYSNYGNPPDLTSLFLRHDESAVATETVLIEAIRNSTYRLVVFEALESLLKRDGGLGTTPAMLKAVKSNEVMRLLLEHQPDCHITADVVLDLIGKGWGRLKILKVLVEYRKTVEFTAEIRKALDEEFQSQADREAVSDTKSRSQSDKEAVSDKESQSEDDQETASDEESQSEDDWETVSDEEELFYKLERRPI